MGLEQVVSLATMPVVDKSSALWDLNINLKSTAPLKRLASLNHPIQVQFAAAKTIANVQLAPSTDRRKVPCKDFVLMFRDAAVEAGLPVAMAVDGPTD